MARCAAPGLGTRLVETAAFAKRPFPSRAWPTLNAVVRRASRAWAAALRAAALTLFVKESEFLRLASLGSFLHGTREVPVPVLRA
jgi:hypothetical protein